jgi:hypothetical protein
MPRKLPRHVHYPEESQPFYQSVTSIDSVPVLDWTKMAFDNWEKLIAQCVNWTAAQTLTVLGSWANMVATGALGLLDFAQNLWTGILKGANLGTFGVTQDYTLTKFADGFFAATTEGRGKFATEFVNEALLAVDAVTQSRIKNAEVVWDKLSADVKSKVGASAKWFAETETLYLNTNTTIVSDATASGGQCIRRLSTAPSDWMWGCPAGISISGGNYWALFRMKVSNNSSSANLIVIDVAVTARGVIASRQLHANDFEASGVWQTFAVPVELRQNDTPSFECRGWSFITGITDVYCDYVAVIPMAKISTDLIEAYAITAAKIAVGTIIADNIHANAIETDKILASAVVSSKIALWRLSSDPTLVAGMLWWRSDLNQIRFYDGTTVQYIPKFPIAFDVNNIVSFAWSTFVGLLSGGLSALTSAGAIATGAIDSLGQMITGFFTATADSLAKFAENLFPSSKLLVSLPRENQVYNGEFEIDFNSDGIPDGWIKVILVGSPTFGRSSAENYKGKYSAYITTDATSWGIFFTDYIPIQANRKYVVTVCVKGSKNGTASDAVLAMWFYDANKSYLSWAGGDTSVTTSWVQKSFVGTADTTARYARVGLSNRNFNGTIYFDDVQCYEQKNLAEFIMDDLLGWSKIAGTFATFKAAITDAINWGWSELSTAVQNTINAAGAWIGTIVETIKTSRTVIWTQVTKSAGDVVTTIANWGNIITSFGAWSVAQILGVLTSWTNVTNVSALGNFPIAKLDIQPYKLPTSAYNYIMNPSFEYGTWGGSEYISTTAPKFGKQCIRLDATGNTYSGYSNFVDIRGLSKFAVSAWTWVGTVITGNFYLRIFFYHANKTPCESDYWDIAVITSVEGDWTQHSLTFTLGEAVPSDCAFIRVMCCWWNTNGNPNGSCSIDGWQFNTGDQIPVFQDFTTYSFNWCPEKIETNAITEFSVISDTWQTVLKLESFECESTMLLLIFSHVTDVHLGGTGMTLAFYLSVDAPNDDDQTQTGKLTDTYGNLSTNSSIADLPISLHSIAILAKGLHTLRLHVRKIGSYSIVIYQRRLSMIKSFYQGGTS